MMTLGDFVKHLVARLSDEGISIPYEDESPWHNLFYELKNLSTDKGKPEFLNKIRFDWDGSYPKCKKLSEFLHALYWNVSVSAQNPRFDTISLPREIAELWRKQLNDLGNDEKNFFQHTIELAKKEFQVSFV